MPNLANGGQMGDHSRAGLSAIASPCGRRIAKTPLTGRIIDARARELPFNSVTTPGELAGRALEMANGIAQNGPLAVKQIKKSVNFGTENRLALAFDREASEVCYPTQDRLEGVAAFNEKRQPRYTGK
jgi:enoyl-CoA hydratase/carnithine racemase